MRYSALLVSVLIIAGILAFVIAAVPANGDTQERNGTPSADPPRTITRVPVNPERAESSPTLTPGRRSGEVEFPMGSPGSNGNGDTERTPTILPPTPVPSTRTIPPTIGVTPSSTVPVVTVTVIVNPSGPVYQPVYYYPPYYPYPVDSYYPSGSLTVRSRPSGAVVILDGYNAETTPWTFTGLTRGYHTVEIDYPGYEAYVRSVYIEGPNTEFFADLTELVRYGSFFIDTTPRGADVYVDGNYQGTSPVTVSAMSRGPHRIEVHRAGYDVLTSTQYITAGDATLLNLALTRSSSSSEYGSIDIASAQAGALVYLDGIYKGSTPAGTAFNLIAVAPGTHTLLLHLPGYTDFTRTVEVLPGQVTSVNHVFVSPSPGLPGAASPPGGSGVLIVTSDPAGGQVYLDNQFRGVAPVTIYNVASGSHIVNMKLPGYSDWSTSVEVPANQMVQVPATLVPGSNAGPVPTRAPVSPATILAVLAVVTLMVLSRSRK